MKLNIYPKWSAILLAFLFTTICSRAQEAYEVRVKRYVEQYKELAIREQNRTGVPASIKLAQGVLETQAGASELCLGAYNHFGIKCKKEWKGQTYTYTDDRPDECFRKYTCVNDSYIDHSDYLRSQPRYSGLFALQITDYKGWAIGLKRCGYATSPTYTQQLIKIIETFNLQDYTIAGKNPGAAAPAIATFASYKDTPIVRKSEIVPEEDAQPVVVSVETPQYRTTDAVVNNDIARYSNETGSFHANGFRAFYGHKGDVLLEQAIKYKIRYAHLLELNDLPDAPLEADMLVYLEKKNPKGLNEKHIVKEGETMLQIAQLEAIQLRQLRMLNMLDVNEEPTVGTTLQLRQMTSRKPAIRDKNAVAAKINFPVQAPVAARKEPEASTTTQPAEQMEPEPVAIVEPIPDATPEKKPEPVAKKQPVPVKEEVIEKPIAATPQEIAAAPKVVATLPVVKEEKKTPEPVQKQPEQIIIPKENPVVKTAAPVNVEKKEEEVKQEAAFNIANEKAVEELPKPKKQPAAPVERVVKQAVVKNTEPEQTTPAEPVSEFDALKAKLDEAVFAEDTKPATKEKAAEEKTKAKPEPVAKVAAAPKPAPKEVKPAAKGGTTYYEVKKGDTAFAIAKKYGISMKQLKAWNNLDFENIRPGQKLVVKR